MLKERLLRAGVEEAVWISQFGFRRGFGTEDAIFIARRRIELAWAQRGGKASLLALDWRKAFDSINVISLIDALRRFGIPSRFLEVLAEYLNSRKFYVQDCGLRSALQAQRSGISQGCTLSPLLFIVVMSVLLHDAVAALGPEARAAYERGDLADLVYADDTLLMGVSDAHVQEYLAAISEAGKRYGLELHAAKFQLISTDASTNISTPDDMRIPVKASMEYLGSVLAATGESDTELNRRLGMAKADFNAISKVWSHSSLTWKGKLRVFSAIIESKLLYSLSSKCLSVAEARRLDGFQNRCIRKILGIKPAFISRVSNKDVLGKAGHQAASEMLRRRRLQLLGKIFRQPAPHPLRKACFIGDTSGLATDQYIRRRGRPAKEWTKLTLDDARRLFVTQTTQGTRQWTKPTTMTL